MLGETGCGWAGPWVRQGWHRAIRWEKYQVSLCAFILPSTLPFIKPFIECFASVLSSQEAGLRRSKCPDRNPGHCEGRQKTYHVFLPSYDLSRTLITAKASNMFVPHWAITSWNAVSPSVSRFNYLKACYGVLTNDLHLAAVGRKFEPCRACTKELTFTFQPGKNPHCRV
jgi:hypothetical protein